MKNYIIGFVCLLFGGLIYLMQRDTNLLMFYWCRLIGLDDVISSLRNILNSKPLSCPTWLIYSLPNALWLMSGILFFDGVWKERKNEKLFWISLFLIIAVGSELGQLVDIIPGTFDIVDLLLMIVFFIISWLIIKKANKKECVSLRVR